MQSAGWWVWAREVLSGAVVGTADEEPWERGPTKLGSCGLSTVMTNVVKKTQKTAISMNESSLIPTPLRPS